MSTLMSRPFRVMITAAALALCWSGPVSRCRAVDFKNDLIPLFTRHGCNAGACHGAAIGRGGFKLSLYGGDPQADYESIVRRRGGRRVNLAKPEESLLLLKPAEYLSHGGGAVFEDDSPSAQLIVQWVREGAHFRGPHRKALVRVDVQPRQWVGALESDVPLRVVAHFADGTARDVTRWTLFHVEDESAVSLDAAHRAVVHRRGRQLIVARYQHTVAPIELIVPMTDAATSPTPAKNEIDRHINAMLAKLRLPASPAADDAAFVRRATLDLNGRLPTPKQVEAFVRDESPNKRARLVDQLVANDAFVEYWTLRFAKLLRLRPRGEERASLQAYHAWLREQLSQQASYRDIARQLILSSGDTQLTGPPNFYRSTPGPREQAEFFSELFMGSRLRCANCHNHPLDRWTQDDYHGLAAVFARLEMGRVVQVKPSGSVIHPRTNQEAVPRIPGERFLDPATGDGESADPRVPLADWITAEDNPYFAKAIVNRLWQALMGRGLVEPVDDFRDTNPATHPALLDYLAADFRQHNYQIRHTIKRIANTEAYRRSSAALPANALDDRYYSRALKRPLSPEVLADAVSDVLQAPATYGSQGKVRAVSLIDPTVPSTSLDILGRCNREDSCDNESASSAGLPKQLHLMNGPLLNKRIHAPTGRLSKLRRQQLSPLQVISKFYLVALSRPPNPEEREHWRQQLAKLTPDEQQAFLEDFLWGLLCCREFAHNH